MRCTCSPATLGCLRICPSVIMFIHNSLSDTIVDAVHISKFLSKAHKEIPAAVVTLEADPSESNLARAYGLLAGYMICLTGHRKGVIENMTAEEVHLAPEDKDGRRVIKVKKHKTAGTFGHALVPLTKDEYSWLSRFLYHRHKYCRVRSHLLFANSSAGICKRLLRAFQHFPSSDQASAPMLAVLCKRKIKTKSAAYVLHRCHSRNIL
ncbi:hypothetical protein MATL_G00250940 [Megalops atlanticus]|uniref:Uncharacterized protein n=1 Tax=Megalops atlanticus TaxID=7932 RepID=A0A9D3PES1_MEGAT|nr:hypothetical protein MATL_G00250940 [Megalops atlanticus]